MSTEGVKVYSVKEVAQILKTTCQQVRKMIQNEELAAVKVGREDYRYAQIKAILFDCKANCYGITALAEKVYKKTGMPSLILSRSIARIHLYINRRMICLADSGDLGFDDDEFAVSTDRPAGAFI